jgi:hypothetical protein
VTAYITDITIQNNNHYDDILTQQAQSLNGSGELYLQKYPKLGVKLVDGSSLAAAVVVNSIPQGTDQVVLAGNISKVARAVAAALCKKNIKVGSKYSDVLHFNHMERWYFCTKYQLLLCRS